MRKKVQEERTVPCEIERKFLVVGDYKSLAASASAVAQGYICAERGRTVRVRIRGERGYLTIKGPSLDGGLSRYEWEKELPLSEARELMQLCGPGAIEKTRWLVPWEGHTFEVDEFHGANEGLVIAEVELARPDEAFARPPFLGRELTGDVRFYNTSLGQRPYTAWPEAERAELVSAGR